MAEQLTHPEFLLDTVEHAAAEFTWQDFYWMPRRNLPGRISTGSIFLRRRSALPPPWRNLH
jgi:hypothetical protein